MAETTTTEKTAVERRAAFMEEQRVRLLDPAGDAPELAGSWAEALVVQLQRRIQSVFSGSPLRELTIRERVVTCFAEAGDGEVRKLFRSLREAMLAVRLTCSDDAWWVNALTCFALLRTLSLDVLDGHLKNRDVALLSESGAANFPTNMAVLASMAYTTLYTGLLFDGSQAVWKKRWTDLPEFSNATDTVDAILRELACCLSDEEARRLPRRINPDNPIHDREIGRLQNRFADDRDDGVASGLCIRRPPGLGDDIWLEALRQLAQRLTADVVGYEERNAGHLSLEASKVGPDALADRISEVFAAFREDGSRQESPPLPEQAGWDFFVSHASEDKKSFVDDLVGRLQSLKQRVWYDKDQILSGDAPVVSIEEGLKRSRHAVLVISRQSIDKPGWVSAEWEALLTAQISLGKPTIHCVLLGVEHAELMDAKPFLGRGRSLKGDTGVDHVVVELMRVVQHRPGA